VRIIRQYARSELVYRERHTVLHGVASELLEEIQVESYGGLFP